MTDIHTHDAGRIGMPNVIYNLHEGFEGIPEEGWYSAGLHPWFLTWRDWAYESRLLERALTRDNVLAVGECGLDTRCSTSMELQRIAFRRQLEIARGSGKPIVIHSVRTHTEILDTARTVDTQATLVFHGFNRHGPVSDRILAAGHYLSYGHQLLNEDMGRCFRSIPEERVLLETDSSGTGIGVIHEAAADAAGVTVEEMAQRIRKNAIHVFGPSTCFA